MIIETKYGKREILIREPKAVKGTIIALHGFLQTPESFEKFTDLSEFTNYGYRVIYPKARFRSWFTLFDYTKADLNFISTLAWKYYENVNLFGFSDGAYFANYIANYLFLSINCLVSYAGGIKSKFITEIISGSTPNFKPKKVIILDSLTDKLVAPYNSLLLKELYESKGCETKMIMDKTGGHTWNKDRNFDIIKFIESNYKLI